MRKNLLYKMLLCGFFLLPCVVSNAQSSFGYKSALDTVVSGGFYRIPLSPSIISKCKNDLHDIRILDHAGRQVPYVLRSGRPAFEEKYFIELPILSVKKEADKQTHILIQNISQKEVGELLLVIKNTDAERTVSISGSNDQEQWFVIKENILLTNLLAPDTDRFFQTVSFPNSRYKFFEFTIIGKDILPINIIKAGMYEGRHKSGEYVQLHNPAISQKDSSDHSSYVSVIFNDTYVVNKLQPEVQGPKLFRRNISIRDADEKFDYNPGNYILSSATDNSYVITARTKKLVLIIENQDSPPVKVLSVKAYQLSKYLLTYLEPAETYQLVFSNSAAGAPQYDLEFFRDSLNNTVNEIGTGLVIKNLQEKISPAQNSHSMIILWIVIIAVLGLLLVLTVRMTKEVSKKENREQL